MHKQYLNAKFYLETFVFYTKREILFFGQMLLYREKQGNCHSLIFPLQFIFGRCFSILNIFLFTSQES